MDRTADGRAGAPHAGIGAALPRLEDERFLTGRGRYVADVALPGMVHACVVRSPHAHARIRSVDTAAARAAPGMLLVLTGADAAHEGLGHLTCPTIPQSVAGVASRSPSQAILTQDKARHVGDRIALVVAETLDQARDAAELVAVDYAPLPSVTASDAALAPGAPLVWDEAPGNLCYRIARGDKDATDAAFARAAHVARLDFHYPRASAAAIEPRASVADYDPARRRVTLYSTTQAPFRVREVLAGAVFKMPQTDFRVIAPDVGGGFGAKGPVYPEDALTVWAARTLGRPVKWVSDRAESLASDSHGRDQREAAELAFDADGRILALRAAAILDVGGYLVMSAGVPGLVAMHSWTSVYHVPAMYAEIAGAFTNTQPIGPYRGTSRPECTFVIERLVDKAAREMGIDGIELRRRNMIPASAMPYTTHGHQTYDAGDFALVLERALAASDWSGFPARREEARGRGRLRGIGMCMHVESAGLYGERMELRVDSGGSVTVQAGTMATGQGHETMYAQLVAGWLGVPIGRVRVMQGDTDQVLFGRGTFAERSAMTGGSALKGAVDEVVRKGRRLAAHMLEAAESDVEFADGSFRVAGTDRAVPFAKVAGFAHAPMGLPEGAELGLDGTGSF
ncbi:MAG TPA: xanthine dehydrogenase family protein molybdopterin-binding subunit, partial [Alphaproteobacteria bacterium]